MYLILGGGTPYLENIIVIKSLEIAATRRAKMSLIRLLSYLQLFEIVYRILMGEANAIDVCEMIDDENDIDD